MIRRSVCCLLFLSATASAAIYQEADVDVMNRPIGPMLSRGRPVLVLYCNRGTRSVGDAATSMAVRLRDVPFATLVHVDLRGIPSIFHGLAEHAIRRRQEDGVEKFRREFEAAGATPPADAAERLILVADMDGAPQAALGLPEGFKESVAIVLGPDGNEVSRGFFPRDEDRIERAIRDAARH